MCSTWRIANAFKWSWMRCSFDRKSTYNLSAWTLWIVCLECHLMGILSGRIYWVPKCLHLKVRSEAGSINWRELKSVSEKYKLKNWVETYYGGVSGMTGTGIYGRKASEGHLYDTVCIRKCVYILILVTTLRDFIVVVYIWLNWVYLCKFTKTQICLTKFIDNIIAKLRFGKQKQK